MTNTNRDATANQTTSAANVAGRDLAAVMTDMLLANQLEALATLQAEEAAAGYERALAALVARIQANENHYHATTFPTLKPATIKIAPSKRGQRFLRIWAEDDGSDNNGHASRRVVGFVEAATGLLWKAATWKAPALNFSRGSMYEIPAGWVVGGAAPSI